MIPDLITIAAIPPMWLYGQHLRRTVPQLALPDDLPHGITDGDGSPIHLLSLGESSLGCFGLPSHEDGVTAHIARQLSETTSRPVKWTTHGLVGATVSELAETELPDIHADIVFICMGVNDTKNLVRRARWREGWAKLLVAVQRYEATVVVSDVPPLAGFPFVPWWMAPIVARRARLLQEALDQVTVNHDVVRAPLVGHMTPDMFAADGFHPGIVAHRRWAEIVHPTFSDAVLRGHSQDATTRVASGPGVL